MNENKVAILNKFNGPIRFTYEGKMIVIPSFKKTNKEFIENKIEGLDLTKAKIIR